MATPEKSHEGNSDEKVETGAPAWIGEVPGLVDLLSRTPWDTTLPESALPRKLDSLASKGALMDVLRDWSPGKEEYARLKLARSALSALAAKANTPAARVEKALHNLHGAMAPSSPPWTCLGALVEAWLCSQGRPALKGRVARPPAPAALPARRPAAQRRTPRRPGPPATQARDRFTGTTVKPAKPFKPVNVQTVTDFGRQATELLIYIDESWPKAVDDGGAELGVIAGLVWSGSAPNPAVLAYIKNHETDEAACLEAIRNLMACPHAFPFVMPLTLPPGTNKGAQAHYDELVRTCLRILLGWLLPSNGPQTTLRIFLERHSPHPEGDYRDEFFRGYLRSLQDQEPTRYGRWDLETVRWVGKEHGYIAYGDVLARLPNRDSTSGKSLAQHVDYRQLPGYLHLSLDLLPRLDRVLAMDRTGDVEDLLDFSLEVRGTALHRTVMDDLRPRMAAAPALQEKLWDAMAQRFLAKERDLNQLRWLFAVVLDLAGAPAPTAGLRLRLLHTLTALQAANHDGAPTRVLNAIAGYDGIRQEALELDRELVACTGLNLQVHLCDRMDFAGAAAVANRLNDDPLFPALPAAMRGRAHSAHGQVLSMRGEYAAADASFQKALALFARAPISDTLRQGETDQTAVYRAMNGLDALTAGVAGFTEQQVVAHLEAVLGPLEPAAVTLASAGPLVRPYHHHLLVRALFQMPSLTAPHAAYLAGRPGWLQGDSHPWELIAMYRAILLFQTQGDDEEGQTDGWFRTAMEVALGEQHGATLTLIGAMIAAAAWSCFDDPVYQESAQEALALVTPKLPAAAPQVARLQTLLASAPEYYDDGLALALGALPFNYH